jgi:hypothetical protein
VPISTAQVVEIEPGEQMQMSTDVQRLSRPPGWIGPHPRDQGFADSAVEEAVSSEPVSEVEEPGTREGANSGRVMDDSGIVKTLFRARISPEIVPLSLRPAPPSGH